MQQGSLLAQLVHRTVLLLPPADRHLCDATTAPGARQQRAGQQRQPAERRRAALAHHPCFAAGALDAPPLRPGRPLSGIAKQPLLLACALRRPCSTGWQLRALLPPAMACSGRSPGVQACPDELAEVTLGPLIGRGEHGRVYRGWWRSERVAVKAS